MNWSSRARHQKIYTYATLFGVAAFFLAFSSLYAIAGVFALICFALFLFGYSLEHRND